MSFHLRMIIIKASALSAFEEAEAFFKVSKTIYKIAIVNLSHTIQSAKPTKKECKKPINHSHIADLRFAYCRLATRILFIFHRIVFLARPECAVEPILLNIIRS